MLAKGTGTLENGFLIFWNLGANAAEKSYVSTRISIGHSETPELHVLLRGPGCGPALGFGDSTSQGYALSSQVVAALVELHRQIQFNGICWWAQAYTALLDLKPAQQRRSQTAGARTQIGDPCWLRSDDGE